LDSHIHEISLTALAYGGDAIGRLPDGRALFVPFGLPGERVRVRVTEERRGHARGELLEVLQPDAERVTARCVHFGVCGGCHYQHMSYPAQLRAKTEILRDQLKRIGRIENPPVGPIVPAPAAWNYRNHVQFHLTQSGRPGYIGADGREVLAISECHLPEPALDALRRDLEFEPQVGIERVGLRLGADGELLLALEGSSAEVPELEIGAGISVVHLYAGHAAVLAGADHLTLQVLERDFRVSAGSFFQINAPLAGAMVRHVLELLPEKIETLLDVYCGVGLFSAFLAPRCRRLIGIEASAAACEDFSINLDEFEGVELYEGAAEIVVPRLAGRIAAPACVLVDPPRAGLDRGVLDSIVGLRPAALVYVSCDPATLARDAARLTAAGYRLTGVTPFDLFPQTFHIECIARFEK
jgi:23S rRNA (uracil1939-C5)-methyltransferase